MKINIHSPEGNTMAALGIASRMLREVGRGDEVPQLTSEVFDASSAQEARAAITKAVPHYQCRQKERLPFWVRVTQG